MATFTTADGVNIWFKDWGSGQPVLFSHGWPLNADMWDSQLTHLAENGYRAIAFDRRGFGRSDQPWNGHDYDTFAQDIHALIGHLDLHEVTLVGFSMGGGDITRYIGRYGTTRVKALVLLGAVTPLMAKSDDHPDGVARQAFEDILQGVRNDRAQFIRDFATPFYGLNAGQQVSEGVLSQTLNMALLASLKGTLDCVTAFAEADFRADLAKVDVPTLVIHGDNDQIVPFAATGKLTAAQIAGAQLTVYDNGPHGFTVTHQQQLNADLLAFLQGLQ
ncbi:alpha/beta fold hydrolase [Pantoea sp. 1.19]|uniref:alpha/beta fold hydrolase n=1 Tax=Pantoea sp. 1.19 TaxID=1925589 RepID=UPI0009489367|nr:alpha/beta hydrolase [Pantoea sp. 1.19]